MGNEIDDMMKINSGDMPVLVDVEGISSSCQQQNTGKCSANGNGAIEK